MALFSVFLAIALGQAADVDLLCRSSVRDRDQRATRTVQDGFVVTVWRKSDSSEPERACVVEVRDAAGQLVFAREGHNTRLHADSGRDVDNDGTADLILGHDSTGGSRCCWEYTVVSLRPTPRVVGAFADAWFESDAMRRTVIWSIRSFEDLGPSMSQPPMIAIARQYRGGRIVDITSEYCGVILAGTANGLANLSDDLWQLEGSHRAASRAAIGPPSFEVETTRVSATTVALQMLYCRQEADARELIRQVWPASEQETIQASLATAVAAARVQ